MTIPPGVLDKVIDKDVVQLHLTLWPPRRPAVLLVPQNGQRLNRAAWRWLRRAGQDTPAHELHILSLAWWGLEENVEGEWPNRDRAAVEQQVAALFGWKPENVMWWLVSHPEGECRAQQRADLLRCVQAADGPRQAAAVILSVIYSRLQADCPALQPGATDW